MTLSSLSRAVEKLDGMKYKMASAADILEEAQRYFGESEDYGSLPSVLKQQREEVLEECASLCSMKQTLMEIKRIYMEGEYRNIDFAEYVKAKSDISKTTDG